MLYIAFTNMYMLNMHNQCCDHMVLWLPRVVHSRDLLQCVRHEQKKNRNSIVCRFNYITHQNCIQSFNTRYCRHIIKKCNGMHKLLINTIKLWVNGLQGIKNILPEHAIFIKTIILFLTIIQAINPSLEQSKTEHFRHKSL